MRRRNVKRPCLGTGRMRKVATEFTNLRDIVMWTELAKRTPEASPGPIAARLQQPIHS